MVTLSLKNNCKIISRLKITMFLSSYNLRMDLRYIRENNLKYFLFLLLLPKNYSSFLFFKFTYLRDW